MLRYFIILIGLIAASVSSWAAKPYVPIKPDPALETWRWRSYPELKGLGLQCLTEDQDGNIWFGANDGVRVYNGLTWTTYTSEHGIAGAPVLKLCAMQDGSVYAGTEVGISRFKDGTWTQVLPLEDDQRWGIADLLEGSDGSLWAGTRCGALQIQGETWTFYTIEQFQNQVRDALPQAQLVILPTAEPRSQFKIHDVFEDQQGKMWFGLQEGEILSYDPSRERSAALQFYTQDDGLDKGIMPRLAQTPDGDLWVGYFGGGKVNRFDGRRWNPLELRRMGATDDGTSITVTQDGALWIGGGGGILKRYHNKKWRFYDSSNQPLPKTRIIDLLASTDQAIWLAYRGQEAVRFDYGDTRWSTFEGLHFQCETQDGMQWFLAQDENIVRRDPSLQTWTRYGVDDGLMEEPRRLILTQTGTLWAAGSHEDMAALARFTGQSWSLQKHPQIGKGIDIRSGVFESQDGALWIAGRRSSNHQVGVLKLTDRSSEYVLPPNVPEIVYGIGQSADGTLWFGGEYMVRYDGKTWLDSFEPQELSTFQDWIDAIYTTSEQNLWLGTRSYGAFQYDGKTWIRYDTQQGLVDSRVREIFQTQDGSIWVSTDKGISRFDGKTWLTQALHPELTRDIGAKGLEQTQDGALWITASRQKTWRTTRWHPDASPPETKITLFIDQVSQPGNTTMAWTGADPWRVTPDEEIMFAYRLDGGAWSSFSIKKSNVFQTLSSGEHTFEVKARDRNFNEDPTPAIVHFTVTPPIWQQAWFVVLMVVLLGSIGFQTGRVVQRDRRLRIADQKIIEEMEKELQVAHDMQMSLLPESPPTIEGIDLSGICIPANHVGGDYYQYVFLDEEEAKLAVVLADVSGHAMQAATVALRFSDILRYEVKGRENGTEILAGLDRSLDGQIQPNMFVTCGIGVLDLNQNALTFASAGNPEVYHFRNETGEVEALGVTGVPLGMTLPAALGVNKVFNSTEKILGSGDIVVFASDGVEEACDGTEEFYDQDRLMSVILEYGRANASAEKLRDAILADVRQFLGDVPQEDDLTVVVLRVE